MCNNGMRWWVGLCTILLSCVLLTFPSPAKAAEGDDAYGNALDWVPADASVFSTSLQLKRQIDVVANSNAWKAFREIPSVAMVWQMAEMQVNNPDGPAAMFWQLMELPENQQLAKLLGEMVSDEIAFYAGANMEKFVELASIVQGSRIAPALEAIDGETGDDGSAQMRWVLEAIEEDPSLVVVPEMVFAFKIKDAEAATTQLKRLEVLANMALQQSPIDAKVEREEIGDSEFIVLALDGSMIPWEEEAPAGIPLDDESYQNLKDIISEKEVAIALGQWNGYLLVSIGESTDHLANLGEESLLADNEEFEYIEEHLEEDVVAIQYVSAALMAYQYMDGDDLDAFAEMIDASIQDSDQVPDSLKERISEDLPEAANDLKEYLVTAGAKLGCTMLTDSGYETYSYNWTPQPRLDATKPLEILNHVGGSPLIAIAARGTQNPEDYDLLTKWAGKAIGYFEDFALEEMDESDRAEAEKALEVAKPLLKRIDETTREHLVPALADGQSAIVIDADIESKKWHEEMPESFAELPMAELAIVMGVSDVDELKQAMREYKEIADDAVEAIRAAEPDAIPEDYEIPEAEVSSTSDGTIYKWNVGKELQLDQQIAICGALNDHIAAFATSPELAERVLAEEPLAAAGGSLSDADEPRAIVAGINFAGVIDAIGPWIEYGIRASATDDGVSNDPDEDPTQVQDICSQVRSGLEILKCFRGAWSETTEDDGVWETYTTAEFKDLDD